MRKFIAYVMLRWIKVVSVTLQLGRDVKFKQLAGRLACDELELLLGIIAYYYYYYGIVR